MKKWILYFSASIFGAIVTFALLKWIGLLQKEVKIEYIEKSVATPVAYNESGTGHTVLPDFRSVAQKVTPAVVHIRSSIKVPYRSYSYPFDEELLKRFFGPHFKFQMPEEKEEYSIGSGSGVIIDSTGYIITNHHVIQDAEDIEVILNDNRTFKAKLIGKDPSTDIAVIKIDGKNLPTIPFGNSDEAEVGDWVLAIGNPYNLTSTVTAGIISAKARNIRILRDQAAIESFIQTDAAINPGNSGGALVDLKGTLIGINTAIASPTGAYSGYGFAVPSNLVQKVASDLIEFGSVQRGYLGIFIRDLNDQLAKEINISITQGVVVDSVMKESSAMKAGLKKWDVILKIDDKEVKTVPQFQQIIGMHRPGDVVSLLIHRQGHNLTIPVKLFNKEGKAELTLDRTLSTENIENLLGAEFNVVDEKTAQKLSIEGGVKVTRLKTGKLSRAGVKQGFIITKVNNQKIITLEDFREAISKRSEGGILIEGIYENIPGKYYYGFGLD